MSIRRSQRARPNASHATHKLPATLLVAMIGLLVAMIGYCAHASAAANDEDPGTSMFSFSGFGTGGVVHSSEDSADFTSSSLKPTGAGYSHQWSTDVDTRIGGQVNAHFTSQLSAMVQVVSEQLYDNTYRPRVEWANLKYQLTPEFSIRVGRIVLPTFLLSDSRKVGYANPWVRTPVEIYTLVPVTNSDGVDASYRLRIGDFVHTVSGSYGGTNVNLTAGGQANVRHAWVISETAEYGAATAHISFSQASFNVNLSAVNALFAAFRQFGPQGNALAEEYEPDDKVARFIALGAMYDPGEWFVMGEWGRRDLHSVFGSSTAWYASGGYRVAQFTPYLTYAEVAANSNTSDPGLTVSALPAYLAGPATALNAGLNAVLGSIATQKTISVGMRWDFMKNLDLKLQADHTRLGAGSAGTLINLQPDFQPGGTVNLFSVTIDFVL
jgi:hypothetical protein